MHLKGCTALGNLVPRAPHPIFKGKALETRLCVCFAITNTLRLFSHRSTRLDALAVDANFAKKAEGWVSSCGDVTFWLELMAPSKGGPQFEPDRLLGLS